MAFLLAFFAAGAELIARTGGFFPLAAGLALMLFLNASIKSITGARCGCTVAVTSWPFYCAEIIAWR